MKVYLASGWFTPQAADEVDYLEKILPTFDLDVFSPRQFLVCPPDASLETQEMVFSGNVKHIHESDFVLVNTRDKDLGTIFEAGVAYQSGKPIVYFCAGLPDGANFNLMLSRSGRKVCTSRESLEDYLGRCQTAGHLLNEPYAGVIE